MTVHVSDDTGRIAMLEMRTEGNASDDHGTAEELTRYIYSNHLQSASLELDETGEVISYEEYHPYGTTSYQAMNASIHAVAKRYRYTGKERDEESGLYYHGARYYIPWLCRWSAVDPLEAKYAGMSPYNYGFNNPVIFNDPSGMDPYGPPPQKILIEADNTAVNTVNPYGKQTEYGHLTPDGGRIRFPRGITVTGISNGGMVNIEGSTTGVQANILEGALTSFMLEGESYNAHYKYSDGSFMGYYSKSDRSHFITYDQNNLPYKLNTKEAGGLMLVGWTTAGQTALAAGPEPGPADVGGLLMGIGTTALSLISLFDAASTYVSMSRPKTADDTIVKPMALPFADAVTQAPNDPMKDYFVKYVNAEGFAKFALEGVLKPNEKGLVYLTKEFMTPEEVERDVFIGDPRSKGKGDYMLIFFVDPDQSANIQKAETDPLEWTYRGGNLKIRTGNLLYMGPNPKR